MESNARVKGSNLGIAHAAVAKTDVIVHRVPEPVLRPLVVCVCVWVVSMEGLAVAAKWLIGGVECGVD